MINFNYFLFDIFCSIFKIYRGEVPKLEVQWSPVHKHKFITWGPDIRMYEVINTANSENSKNIDNPKGFILIFLNMNYTLLLHVGYSF